MLYIYIFFLVSFGLNFFSATESDEGWTTQGGKKKGHISSSWRLLDDDLVWLCIWNSGMEEVRARINSILEEQATLERVSCFFLFYRMPFHVLDEANGSSSGTRSVQKSTWDSERKELHVQRRGWWILPSSFFPSWLPFSLPFPKRIHLRRNLPSAGKGGCWSPCTWNSISASHRQPRRLDNRVRPANAKRGTARWRQEWRGSAGGR